MVADNFFDFVNQDEYREILVRDYEELKSCVENNLYKSILVLSGSILEAVLTEFLIIKALNDQEAKSILKKNLAQLIEKAEDDKLISKRAKDLSSVLRDYRNYIHPVKEIRTKDPISKEASNIAFSLLNLILKEIQSNYGEYYGHKADNIFKKLKHDRTAIAIFDDLMRKTNQPEKGNLLSLLLTWYLSESSDNEETDTFFFLYYRKLRPYLNEDQIRWYIEQLFFEVEQGSSHMVMIYFEIFGQDLKLIKNDSIEIIVKYIYKHLGTANIFGADLLKYNNRKFYNNLVQYTLTNEAKNLLYELIHSIVANFIYFQNEDQSGFNIEYFSLFYTLTENISDSQLDKILDEGFSKEACVLFKNRYKIYLDGIPF